MSQWQWGYLVPSSYHPCTTPRIRKTLEEHVVFSRPASSASFIKPHGTYWGPPNGHVEILRSRRIDSIELFRCHQDAHLACEQNTSAMAEVDGSIWVNAWINGDQRSRLRRHHHLRLPPSPLQTSMAEVEQISINQYTCPRTASSWPMVLVVPR